MSSLPRLSLDSLPTAPPPAVRLPTLDPRSLSIGIVHLGVGAFHRAHQAIFTEDAAAATGETMWGILGVTGRSDAVVRQLAPQDGLYGVLTKGANSTSLRVVGAIRDVAWPGDRSADIVRAIAATTTSIVTLTVTEKGYLRAASGGIDVESPGVDADARLVTSEFAGMPPGDASQTLIGLLVRGLARRFLNGRAPLSVVSCDNVAHNGVVAREVVTSLAIAAGASEDFLSWLGVGVAFPSTMVDRITPSTMDDDRAEASAMLGLYDDALVVAEPFGQWVIEDAFAAARPHWELAGAILAPDVAPYETMKLRVLNASHSLLAYLGALRGHATIASAVADPLLHDLALRMIDDDVLPTLAPVPGVDLPEYRSSVLARFANPNLAHTTAQVAMDGSVKLPQRLFPTIADRLAKGFVPRHLALATAAWITYIAATPGLADPIAGPLRSAAPSMSALDSDPRAVVDAMLAIHGVFPAALAQSATLREVVVTQLGEVRELMGA